MFRAPTIVFQGAPGAFSHLACIEAFPGCDVDSRATFERCVLAVQDGEADLAMLPVDNSLAGRVADVYLLLRDAALHIVAEHFLRVRHCLLGVRGASIGELTTVTSHVHALSQCRNVIRELGLREVAHHNTAVAAREVAERGDASVGVIASRLSAELYGLDVLREGVEDAPHNTTRFVAMAREPRVPPIEAPSITTLVFHVRSVPAALYKALGGFATNGVNLTKLESYIVGQDMVAARFFADVEGHVDEERVQRALAELAFFSSEVRVLGVYPADPRRRPDSSP